MLYEEKHKRFAVIFMYSAAVLVAAYLIFTYLWGIIIPFAAAYVFAECFKPMIRCAEKHKKFPKRFAVIVVLFITAGAVIMLIFAAGRELAIELAGLLKRLGDTLVRIRDDDSYAKEIIDKICSYVPFIDLHDKLWEIRPVIDEKLLSVIMSSSDTIANGVLSMAGNAITFLPDAILTTLVVIISTYYFAVDRVRINCFFLNLFPQSVRPKLKKAKDMLFDTVLKYLRAYGLIFLITFVQLLISFWIMGIEYAFVIALATSIVDILPILGTGTVLIPWSVASFISGSSGRGIGLLAAYAVITVSRQVIEPKIVGKFIGLPPLAALAAMFIGFKLIGVAGLILFPLGAIVLWQWAESRKNSAGT